MQRRTFISVFGGAAVAWPLAARAQQPATPVIGYIGAQSRGMYVDRLRTFHEGLEEAGFAEGRNVAIEYRWAENHYDAIPGFLAELIARRVAVIALPDSTPGAIAAKGMTSTIPVVFGISGDPVQLGLVNGWNRPGGNVTGMVLGNAEIVPKRMALIQELVPALTTLGLLVNPTSSAAGDIKFGQEAAPKLGLQLHILNATTESEIATMTGLTTFEPSIAGKWCSMLKEVNPRIKRAAFLANPEIKTYQFYLRAAQTPAAALAIELVPRPIKNVAEITNVVEEFARVLDSGLIVPPDVFTASHGDLIIALAARHRLPAVYAFSSLVSAGGLMSYGTDRVDEMRQAASYIDRILRGDKPSELPVQAPTKFETVVNLKTAKALGITVPPGLLLAADEVIE
jgi:ABC-type uncharacterized transport system substrate-binding protein